MSSGDIDGSASGERSLYCPSAPASVGAKLIGIVQENGRVGIFGKSLTVNEDFLDKARCGRAPEKRFRFASPCLQDGCKQWSDGQCGVIRRVQKALGGDKLGEPEEVRLQPCAIRGYCRWFAERGRSACRACPEVVTDTLQT